MAYDQMSEMVSGLGEGLEEAAGRTIKGPQTLRPEASGVRHLFALCGQRSVALDGEARRCSSGPSVQVRGKTVGPRRESWQKYGISSASRCESLPELALCLLSGMPEDADVTRVADGPYPLAHFYIGALCEAMACLERAGQPAPLTGESILFIKDAARRLIGRSSTPFAYGARMAMGVDCRETAQGVAGVSPSRPRGRPTAEEAAFPTLMAPLLVTKWLDS